MTSASATDLSLEISALIKSAASEEAIASRAPSLQELTTAAARLNLKDPSGEIITTSRDLLSAGIAWLGVKTGRSSDPGARNNYPYADFAKAAEILFGPGSELHGTEHRWGEVSKVFGARVAIPITGKRMRHRICTHLASAILTKVPRASLTLRDDHPESSDTPDDPGSRLLIERTSDLQDLIAFVGTANLLRTHAWHEPVRRAINVRVRELETDRELEIFTRLGDWPAEDVLALNSLLLAVPALPLAVKDECYSQVINALESREISRRIPASMTFVREGAATALTSTGRERRGVGVRDNTIPDYVFVPIPGSHDSVYITRYPVTRWQYHALIPGGADRDQADTPASSPMTNVTTQDAERHCLAAQYQIIGIGTANILIDERIQTMTVPSSAAVRLPARADITSIMPPNGKYAWSGVIDDSIALARRLSYERLLPVGLFPDEIPESGVADISGLVWHWLTDPWSGNSLKRSLRSVHGGGFGKNIGFLAGDCFLGADESTRRSDRGFRLVLDLRTVN